MTSYHILVPTGTTVGLDPEEHRAFAWYDLADFATVQDLLWGMPTILADFGLAKAPSVDPTLADGSRAMLVERA